MLHELVHLIILVYVLGLAWHAFLGMWQANVPAALTRYHRWLLGQLRKAAAVPFFWAGSLIRGSPPKKTKRR